MPGLGLLDRAVGAVVFGDEGARDDFAVYACREARLVLADEVLRGRRSGAEFFWIEVTAAGDAVNVRVLVRGCGSLLFAFAFGQALLSLHGGGTNSKSRPGVKRVLH